MTPKIYVTLEVYGARRDRFLDRLRVLLAVIRALHIVLRPSRWYSRCISGASNSASLTFTATGADK